MNRVVISMMLAVSALSVCAMGCILRDGKVFSDELHHYQQMAGKVEYPDVTSETEQELVGSSEPRLLSAGQMPDQYWDLTLEEAIQIAVSRSRVMRDLGGTVVRTPANARTILEPSIEETDPRQGVYAALSAFDAQYSSNLLAEKNDRALNNLFTAGGTRIFQQDLIRFNQQISKRSAAGTELTLRQNIDYDANNAFANLFPSSWNTNVEASFRQPLLQGAGVQFNRIAGPGNIPGSVNGLLVARTRTETSLVDFELGLRDLVSNVENAYWDLYYAYRDLDSKVAARDASLEIWRRISTAGQAGLDVGRGQREAQAREQYYRFEEDVQNALSGRPGDGTATNNGVTGGTFRGAGGVLYSERRLRLILGLGINDVRIIRPADEPVMVPVSFSWNEISSEALVRRAELRRQRIQLRRRELELAATRNYLLPQLDAVGLYRYRGFGDDLIDTERDPNDPFDTAFRNLTSGDFQEWQLGAELTFPIGFRRAHAAMRHAQLQLARERVVLDEQERQILYDLSNAFAELDRAFAVAQTAYNRRMAAKANVEILRERAKFEAQFDLDQLLDAERRFTDADVRFHRGAVEYVLAVKNVHFEKGTLLDYGQVYLAENATCICETVPLPSSPPLAANAPPAGVGSPALPPMNGLPSPDAQQPTPAIEGVGYNYYEPERQ